MAEVQAVGDDICYLIENHCPICAAAESCAGLCAKELEVFRKTLCDEVKVERTEYLLNDSRRCVYRIRPSF
jgi:predicted ArsR family transcriptional regulator